MCIRDSPRRRRTKGAAGGKGPGQGEHEMSPTGSTPSEPTVLTGLERVRRTAREDKQVRFSALLHHLTVELLRESFLSLERKAAPGIDGQTWKQYEHGLEDRLKDLHGRVPVSYTHLRAHETPEHLVCRLLLEKKKTTQ